MANNNSTTAPGYTKPLGYTRINGAAASTAVGTIPDGATFAMIQCETQSLRWRDDGVAPTATVGMLLATGTILQYTGNLKDLRFFETGASTVINISYYK